MTTSKDDRDIRVHVRERYGQIAGSQSGCCGPEGSDCCSQTSLYQLSDVDDLPAEVLDLSLGCGDPISLAQLQEGQVVLDLGAGGGIDCFLAARRVGPAGHVIGVDMTPAMVEQARANRERMGASNVEFRLGEIEHLPVADESVDVIISNCVVNLSPDKFQVFREALRVLRPGGKLAISDVVTNGPLPESLRSDVQAWSACVAGALEVQQFVQLLEAAGFENVQVAPTEQKPAMAQDGSSEPASSVVFSARISARKPSPNWE